MRSVVAVLVLVFAGAQTLAAADCCCSPRPPKVGDRSPVKLPSGPSDCGCEGLAFRSDAQPAPSAPAIFVDPPAPLAIVPVEELLLAPVALPLLDPGVPDRDVGPPLHLLYCVLLV